MKTTISALALTLALAGFAHAGEPEGDDDTAATPPPAHTTAAPKTASAPMSQRDRMRKCNADAHGKKGSDRREFMSQCLSKKHAS